MLSWQQAALLIAPAVLLPTTLLCYQTLGRRFGLKRGYLGGFLFYWLVWCILFPLALLGPSGFSGLFRSVSSPFGQPWPVGLFCLAAPPLVSFASVLPRAARGASAQVVMVSALIAIVNGTLEEVLWRGAYSALFPGNVWVVVLYASAGFAVWHFAPQSIFPYRGPGGKTGLVGGAAFLGILWSWVAVSTGTILWTVPSHILVDFTGMGARVYLEDRTA